MRTPSAGAILCFRRRTLLYTASFTDVNREIALLQAGPKGLFLIYAAATFGAT